MRSPLLPVVLAALFAAPVAHAGRPSPPERSWQGLDPAAESAGAHGVVALRVAPSGRVRIPGGSFVMGSTPSDMLRAIRMCKEEVLGIDCDQPEVANGFRTEGKAHEVRLSPFLIDRTEVTVEAYMRCVVTGACAPPGFARNDPRFDQPRFPVTQVRWDDAVAYCAWAGGRLPTEAEWEYAARGPTSREYPWGAFYNSHLANHGSRAIDRTDGSDGFVGLAPVGSFPDGATPLGLLDMAGNVAEWVDEIYAFDEEGYGYADTAVVDPRPRLSGPLGPFHVVRGGSYLDGAAWIRAAARAGITLPRAAHVGFRCAADTSS